MPPGIIQIVIDGDASKADKALTKSANKIKALEDKLKKVRSTAKRTGTTIQNTGDKVSKSFGTSALGKLTAFAGGFLTIGAGIAGATAALRAFDTESDRIAQKQIAAEIGLKQLAQLSGGDPEIFAALKAKAIKTFEEGGARTVEEAAGVQFALESASAADQRKLVSDLFGITGVGTDTIDLVQSAAALQEALGEEETGSVRDIFSKGFAISEISPSTVPELIEAAAQAGVASKTLGISDEEILAATAIISKPAGGAAIAGTQLNQLLNTLIKKGEFEDKTLAESIAAIEEKGLSDADLVKFFGRQEAFKAFGILVNSLDLLAEVVESQRVAVSEDLVGKIVNVPGTDPEIFAAEQVRIQANLLERQRVNRGVLKNLLDASELQIQQAEEDEGRGRLSQGVRQAARKFIRFGLGDVEQASLLTEDLPEVLARRENRGEFPQTGFAQFLHGLATERDPTEKELAAAQPITQDLVDGLRAVTEVLKQNTEATQEGSDRLADNTKETRQNSFATEDNTDVQGEVNQSITQGLALGGANESE